VTIPNLPGPRIRLRVCGATDPGIKREENQDSFLIADLSAPELRLPTPEEAVRARVREMEVGARGALFMVADGMGGAAGGRVASKMATSHVLASIVARWTQDRGPSPDRFIASIEEAVRASNALIHEQSNRHPAYHGMGTTATIAGVFEDYLYLAQIGDSRAYLVREGRCTQLTRDQSFENFAVERGLMSPREVEQSAHRNVILQALGPNSTVEADLTFQHLRLGDVLVLCSDGLFRVVEAREIAAAAAMDVAAGCDALIATARERGAPDNVTVLLARFGGEGLRPPLAEDPVGRQPLRERGG
jgi:protein phosphatase